MHPFSCPLPCLSQPTLRLRKFLVLALACSFIVSTAVPALAKEPEVVVYGGTPGGIASAIAAAREGRSVRLVETTKHLGGLTSGGLSHTDVGPRPEIIGGIAREFFTRADA